MRLGLSLSCSSDQASLLIPVATTTQAPDRDDILNIGGFSDAVFSVVASCLDDDGNRFVSEVEAIELSG